MAENYIDELDNTDIKKLPYELRKMMSEIPEVQEDVLLDILQISRNTEFGEKYDFTNIKSIEEYKKKVPVTDFEDYKDSVERMKDGEENILFPGKAESFVVSSGTTGDAKYIPESKTGARAKSLIGKFRTVEMLSMVPQILQPGRNILTLVNSSVYGITKGGIVAGSASGQAVEVGVMADKMTLPALLLTAQGLSSEAAEYLTVLFAINDRNIAAIICNNMAHFQRIMKLLNSKTVQILNDLENNTISVDMPEDLKKQFISLLEGKINKERVDELKAIYKQDGEFTVVNLWPGFIAVSCWLSGSVGRSVKEVKNYFPKDTLFIEWGYGASEGKFNIPVTPGKSEGYPGIFGIFFEFLPLGGSETVLLQDTKPDELYELVLTNYSGFYRYNIHDIVKVKRDSDGFPLLTFLCKSKDHIDVSGKKFYSCDLLEIVEKYEEARNVYFVLIQGRSKDNKLEIIVESKDAVDIDDFKAYIEAELKKANIELSGIIMKEEGYRDSLFEKVLDSGKSVVSTKLPVFID